MITLDILYGYAMEETAWEVLADISAELVSLHHKKVVYGDVCGSNIYLDEENRWHLLSSSSVNQGSASSDIWQLAATIFQLLMGVPVFGGRTENQQTAMMPVPTFNKEKYDSCLSDIIGSCLQFDPKKRPDAVKLSKMASKGLERYRIEQKGRIPRDEASNKDVNVLKFWPERME